MCLKPFTLHWRLKVTMWKVTEGGEGRGEKKKSVLLVCCQPPPLSFKMTFRVSVFLFIFSNALLLTSIDSNVHPQWQVTNRSAGRDVHPTFVFLQFSPYFCICWKMLLLQRYWQKGASTLLLVVEKGNQWHWVDLTHFQLILPFLNISSLYIRCVMMSASLAPTKVSWLVNCWQFQIFRLLLRLCLCALVDHGMSYVFWKLWPRPIPPDQKNTHLPIHLPHFDRKFP